MTPSRPLPMSNIEISIKWINQSAGDGYANFSVTSSLIHWHPPSGGWQFDQNKIQVNRSLIKIRKTIRRRRRRRRRRRSCGGGGGVGGGVGFMTRVPDRWFHQEHSAQRPVTEVSRSSQLTPDWMDLTIPAAAAAAPFDAIDALSLIHLSRFLHPVIDVQPSWLIAVRERETCLKRPARRE